MACALPRHDRAVTLVLARHGGTAEDLAYQMHTGTYLCTGIMVSCDE